MALLKKTPKSHEQLAAETAEKERKEEQKRVQEVEKERQRFLNTPAGQARVAFEAGDHVFQYSIDVVNQQAIIIAMGGSATRKRRADPTAILNEVCHEGWELVNGDFVFVQEGQQSRDKFMSSGQNIAVKGTVVGYYLFKRCEANRREPLPEPWMEGQPAAWYIDPANPSRYRYWARGWTEDTQG